MRVFVDIGEWCPNIRKIWGKKKNLPIKCFMCCVCVYIVIYIFENCRTEPWGNKVDYFFFSWDLVWL